MVCGKEAVHLKILILILIWKSGYRSYETQCSTDKNTNTDMVCK